MTMNCKIEDIAFRVRGKPSSHTVILKHHGRDGPSQDKEHDKRMLIVDA